MLISYLACQEERDLLLVGIHFGKCHRLTQQLWHLPKLGEGELTILVILLGKPDIDTWIRALMNVNSFVHVTLPQKHQRLIFVILVSYLEYLQELTVVLRAGDRTAELFGKWCWN